MKKTTLTALILLVGTSFGSEIDPFYRRQEAYALEDAQPIINAKTKELLADSLNRANEKEGCDKKHLYRSLRKNFRNHVFGNLTPFIIESPEIQKIEAPIEISMYREFSWYEAPIPGFYARVFKDPSGKVLRMGPYLIGTDKFEHFLGTGFRYFRAHYLKGKSLESALEIGRKAEANSMGVITTGVFSYGDLVANFNGMRFWNHVLGENEDVLGENLGPYVACVEDKWIQVGEIDWLAYMDHAWDEGINCSRFRNKALTEKVKKHLQQYAEKFGTDVSCPADQEKLDIAAEKYGELSNDLLNFEGMIPMDK